MQCSAIFLEERVQAYCQKHNKDEGTVWQEINTRYLKQHDRNIMWEKEQEEKEQGQAIEMAQAFAKNNLVHSVIEILDEWENIG